MLHFADGTVVLMADDGSVPEPQARGEGAAQEMVDKTLEGFTPKQLVRDLQGRDYIAKKPDPLSVENVYQGFVSPTALQRNLSDKFQNVKSVELETTYLEILMPIVVKKLFNDLVLAPDNYLHLGSDGQVWVLSRMIDNFEEFLHQKPCIATRDPDDTGRIPSRESLSLTADEAYIIGQLYAVALVINHGDLLNSKLLNSGLRRQPDGSLQAAIVDFGMCAHVSYKGRHVDTLAQDDPGFLYKKTLGLNFFGKTYLEQYNYRHALPFDRMVAPMMMHSLIESLYEMSADDEISLMMRQGFEKAITTAIDKLEENPNLFVEALVEARERCSVESLPNMTALDEILTHSFYQTEPEQHNLITILSGRVYSCLTVLQNFKAGQTLVEQQQQVRDEYYESQLGLN